jgi:predicted phosphodiesterase
MGEKGISGEIICEYLEKYPNLMKLTLARLIYKENPEVFASVDSVRSRIRHYTGNSGSRNLELLTDRRFLNICQPQTYKEEREDFILPTTANNCLLLSDIHVPYHEPEAVKAAVEWGKTKGINTIILTGDFMDFYQLSSFTRDPRMRELRDELDAGYEMLYYISSTLPKAKIYFLPGNHERRLENYLRIKAPELLGASGDELDLDFFLKFSDFGVTYLKNRQIIKAGELWIGHGDDFGVKSNTVNPARTFMLKGKVNYIGGHFHTSSEHTWKRMDGKVEGCWSLGCLSGLYPEFRKFNEWSHGFGHVKINEDGTFRVFNAKIINGKVL